MWTVAGGVAVPSRKQGEGGLHGRVYRERRVLPGRLGLRWSPLGGSPEGSFEDYVTGLQDRICDAVERADGSGKRFITDRYARERGGGYGITRVLEGGDLVEKAACNVSVISGVLTAERAKAMSGRGRKEIDVRGGQSYSAVAMSLVFHAASPMVPTFRADVRYFAVEGVEGGGWFGGGADLTPSYYFEEDVREFHAHWRDVLAPYGADVYPRYKAACDAYFYIPMRKERRGVGGIFFDDVQAVDVDEISGGAEAMTRAVGSSLLDSWLPITERRRGMPFTAEQREWQLMRRGRYIEFNLLYDRGVRFGLDGGRIESIMVSAPPLVAWNYNVVPEPGSPEAQLVDVLQASPPHEYV